MDATTGDGSAAGTLLDDRLERLARLADRLEAAEAALAKLPGMLAMLADIADEWAGSMVAQGIELDTSVKQGVHAMLWLGQRVSEPELERLGILLRSEVLDPQSLAAVGKTGRALAACHEATCTCEEPERLGPMGLMKALGDPDVQRALAFAVRVAKEFGRQLPASKG